MFHSTLKLAIIIHRTELRGKGASCYLSGKESICNAGASGDMDSIPGSGRCPEEGHGNPLQHSCQENSMDRGAWRVIVHGMAESNMTLAT